MTHNLTASTNSPLEATAEASPTSQTSAPPVLTTTTATSSTGLDSRSTSDRIPTQSTTMEDDQVWDVVPTNLNSRQPPPVETVTSKLGDDLEEDMSAEEQDPNESDIKDSGSRVSADTSPITQIAAAGHHVLDDDICPIRLSAKADGNHLLCGYTRDEC